MARQGQGDENGDGNDDWPWLWYFVVDAVLYYSLLCLAGLWQRLAERLSYLLLRIAEQWQRIVEDRQRSRKPGTLLSVPTSQVAQPRSRTKEDVPPPLNENTDGDGSWGDIDISLAMETNPDDLVIPVNLQGEFNFSPLVDQLPEVQAPLQDMDGDPVDPAEADLALLLVQGEVVGVLQQIQRDEANIVARPQVLQPIAEEATVPLSLVPDVAVGAPQHRSTVLPAPEVDADDDAPIFEMTAIDAPGLGAAVTDNTTQGLAFNIIPQEVEKHEASMVAPPDRVCEIGKVHNVHDEHFLMNSGLQLLQAVLIELGESSKVSQDVLIPSAVQQALVPAVKAVDSACGEVELAVLQGQDEANTDRRPQVPSTSTSEEILVPPDLEGGVVLGGSQHLPTVLLAPDSIAADTPDPEILADEASEHDIIPVDAPAPVSVGADALEHDIGAAGIIIATDALDLPQLFETNGANSDILEPNEIDDETGDPSVQRIIQLASTDGDPGNPRVATPSLSVPAGDLSSQLEVQMSSAVTKGGVTKAEATLPNEI